jgi:hypothetical protein
VAIRLVPIEAVAQAALVKCVCHEIKSDADLAWSVAITHPCDEWLQGSVFVVCQLKADAKLLIENTGAIFPGFLGKSGSLVFATQTHNG